MPRTDNNNKKKVEQEDQWQYEVAHEAYLFQFVGAEGRRQLAANMFPVISLDGQQTVFENTLSKSRDVLGFMKVALLSTSIT